MQPSKSMIDYMMELNRLFPKSPENDIHTPSSSFQVPFSQPTPNYSSSSTDSFSPESFPDLSYSRPQYQPDRRLTETPFALARRPIVGRKILGNPEQKPIEQKSSFEGRFHIEQPFNQTSPIKYWNRPPNARTIANDQKNEPKNLYELFPGESKGFEFKTPVKTPSLYSNPSPSSSISQHSPVSNFGMYTPPQYPNPMFTNSPVSMSPMKLQAGSSRLPELTQKMCTFCRKNGETPLVYMTHSVKEKRGNRNVVTCPILRSHVCSTCGVSGDNAHTITYCPVLRSTNNGVPLKSTTITLKNTRIKSNDVATIEFTSSSLTSSSNTDSDEGKLCPRLPHDSYYMVQYRYCEDLPLEKHN